MNDRGDHYRLRVPKEKDTTDSGGKPCDAYLSPDVKRDVHRFQTAQNIAPGDLLVDLSNRGMRAVVKHTAEQTGDDDFRHVSSHDLRRTWGMLLVEVGVEPGMIIEWDG